MITSSIFLSLLLAPMQLTLGWTVALTPLWVTTHPSPPLHSPFLPPMPTVLPGAGPAACPLLWVLRAWSSVCWRLWKVWSLWAWMGYSHHYYLRKGEGWKKESSPSRSAIVQSAHHFPVVTVRLQGRHLAQVLIFTKSFLLNYLSSYTKQCSLLSLFWSAILHL